MHGMILQVRRALALQSTGGPISLDSSLSPSTILAMRLPSSTASSLPLLAITQRILNIPTSTSTSISATPTTLATSTTLTTTTIPIPGNPNLPAKLDYKLGIRCLRAFTRTAEQIYHPYVLHYHCPAGISLWVWCAAFPLSQQSLICCSLLPILQALLMGWQTHYPEITSNFFSQTTHRPIFWAR